MKKTAILFALFACITISRSFAIGIGINNKAWWDCIRGCNHGSGLCIFPLANDADLSLGVQSNTLVLTVPKTSYLYQELALQQTVDFGQDSQLQPDVAAQLGVKDPATMWIMLGQYPIGVNPDGSLVVYLSCYTLLK